MLIGAVRRQNFVSVNIKKSSAGEHHSCVASLCLWETDMLMFPKQKLLCSLWWYRSVLPTAWESLENQVLNFLHYRKKIAFPSDWKSFEQWSLELLINFCDKTVCLVTSMMQRLFLRASAILGAAPLTNTFVLFLPLFSFVLKFAIIDFSDTAPAICGSPFCQFSVSK